MISRVFLLHNDYLSVIDHVGKVGVEVVGDILLGFELPDSAVGLEKADALVRIHAQQELALGLLHLEEGAEGPQQHAGLHLDQRIEGHALPGLHGLRDAVVVGADTFLVGHPAQQVEQVGRALVGNEQAAQLDQRNLTAAEAGVNARGVCLGAVEDIAGEVGQVGGHDLNALIALGLHHDGRADLLRLGADQLADAVKAADTDRIWAVYMGRDAGERGIGIGLSSDLEGFGLLQADDFVDHFCEHGVVLLVNESFRLCVSREL